MSTSASHLAKSTVDSLPPRSWSMVGWAVASGLSVILTYLIALALGILLIVGGCYAAFWIFSSRLSYLGLALTVLGLVAGPTILWSLIPRRHRFDPDAVLIDLSQEVRLRAELEGIARQLGEQIPAEVYVGASASAGVLRRGGMMGFGGRRALVLGLPLLQMLSMSQFRAILAHEFAHFYGGDTRLGAWVFNARTNMERMIDNLTDGATDFSFGALGEALHMMVVLGFTWYWNSFNRITQSISRRQEFRCDEIACYIGGSDNLEQGLCHVVRAGAVAADYWEGLDESVKAGFQPQLADGFARFMKAPVVLTTAAAALEEELAKATDPLDSHPPLKSRLEKIRELAIAAPRNDDGPAVALIDDLPSLELRLLEKLDPWTKAAKLKPLSWDSVGSDVYIPLWRKQTACLRALLAGQTLSTLPDLLKTLPELAKRVPDPPGTLLATEDRLEHAAEVVSHLLTLSLVDHGWHLYFQPGQLYVENAGHRLESWRVVAGLINGGLKPDTWVEFCEKHGMGDWSLT